MDKKKASTNSLSTKLREILSRESCTLFAGAGVSARAGMKIWQDYLLFLADFAEKYEPAIATLIRKRVAANLLLEAAHYYKTCDEIPIGDRLAKMAEPFSARNYDVKKLSALTSLPFERVVTTNYDRSLLDGFSRCKPSAPHCAELGDPTLREAVYWTEFYIARIHGRAEIPASMVLETRDYEELYKDVDYADFLFSTFTRSCCVFMGFSFVDPAIDRILNFVASKGVFPKKHFAFVPRGSKLVERMAKLNIEVIQYDPANNHQELWDAIAEVNSSEIKAVVDLKTSVPANFETARKLLAVCYAGSKLGDEVTALKQVVVQGIVLSELTSGVNSFEKLCAALPKYFAITPEEAKPLISAAVETLLLKKICMWEEDEVVLVADLSSFETNIVTVPLVEGMINRLLIREKYDVRPELKDAIRKIIEEVLVMRGFDLGAEFAGAETTDEVDPLPTISAAIERNLPGFWKDRKQQIAEVFIEMLRRPEPDEEQVLAELGRLAFGIDLVLQAGRSTMYSLSLPEIVYLDASVLLPALVRGHPLQTAYVGSIEKLQGAAKKSGASVSVFIADAFLDEILNHRKKAIDIVRRTGLEDEDVLERRILYYGADKVNVFIGAYSSWISSKPENPSFDTFLQSFAPYSNDKELRDYLKNKGIAVASTKPGSQIDAKMYDQAVTSLLTAYDVLEAGLEPWERKFLVLKKHEARQLALIKLAVENGHRAVLVTADKQLRRAVALSGFSDLKDSFLSPRNLVQLVDLLIGIEVDPDSLTRLLWTVRVADERAAIKDYLITRALTHYNAAMLLKIGDLLDHYVDEVIKDAKLEGIRLNSSRFADRAKKSSFMDRVENNLFANLAEEVKKLEDKIKALEKKQK